MRASLLSATLVLAAACAKTDAAPPPAPAVATPTALEPWQPVDPSFQGCEGG